jgi:hypothetical protein
MYTTQMRCESYEFMDYKNNNICETIHVSAQYLKMKTPWF